MKGTIKIIAMLLVVMMLVMVSTQVFAFDPSKIVENVTSQADAHANDNTSINEMAGRIIALIRNIAVVAGVVLLSILGIKYMIGSAEEKADYKKSLIPLVVGIIVVMAAAQIVTMIFGFFN